MHFDQYQCTHSALISFILACEGLHNRRCMLGVVLAFERNHRLAMETNFLFGYTITRESYSINCISIPYLPQPLGPKRQTPYSR